MANQKYPLISAASASETRKWAAFARKRAHAEPLKFVAGFRHRLRKGPACKMHAHEALEIVFHKSGEGETRVVGAEPVSFRMHTAIIYAPGAIHDQIMTSPGEDLCVQIEIPRTDRAGLGTIFCAETVTDPILVEEIQSLSDSTVLPGSARQAILNHRVTAVLLALLQNKRKGSSAPTKSPAWRHTRQAEEYLARNYEKIASLQEVADHLGLTLDHLRHVFRQEKKITLIAHLTLLRINRAKFLLRNTGLPLKSIATMAGFSNEYYFSRVFHKEAGQSPAVYRRRLVG